MASAADIARAFEKSAKKLKARNILLRKVLTCAYRYIKENSSDLDHLTEQFGLLCALCSLTTPENERHLQQLQLDARHTVPANEVSSRVALLVPDTHPPLHDMDSADEGPAVADVAYISDSASSSPDASCLLVPSEPPTPGPSPAVLRAASSSNHESDVDVTSPGLAPLRPIDSDTSLEYSDDLCHEADHGSSRCARPSTELPVAPAATRPFGRRTRAPDCILPTSEAASEEREHPCRSVITSSASPLPGVDAPPSCSAVPGYDNGGTECTRAGSLADKIADDPVQSPTLLVCPVAMTAASDDLGYCNPQQHPVSGSSHSEPDASCRVASGSAPEAVGSAVRARSCRATVGTAVSAGPPTAVALFELQLDETALHEGSPPAADRQSMCTDALHDRALPAPARLTNAQLSSDCALARGPPPMPTHRSHAPAVTACPGETGYSDVASRPAEPLFAESVKLEASTAAKPDSGKWTSRGKKRLRSKQSRLDSFFDNNGATNRHRGCADASAPPSGRTQQLTKVPRVEVTLPIEQEAKENVPPQWQATCLKGKTGRKKATEKGAVRDQLLAAAVTGDADDNDFDLDETTLCPLKASVVPVTILNKHGDSTAPRPGCVRQCSFGSSPSPAVVEPCATVSHEHTPPSGKITSGTGRRIGMPGRRLAIRGPAAEPAYVYAEVVRGKTRSKLKGYSCRQCVEYFSSMNLTEEEQRKRLDQVCKHRGQKKPPQTPTGFWDMQLEHT